MSEVEARTLARREEFIFRAAKWPSAERFVWLGRTHALFHLLKLRQRQLEQREKESSQ